MLRYAKTLYKPTRPSDINDKINAFTNNPLPHFFKYAKDKKDNQIAPVNLSFVNKLETMIPNPRLNFKKLGIGEIDYTLMMNNPNIKFDISFTDNGRIIPEETDPIIVKYCEFDKRYYLALDSALCSKGNDRSEAYMRMQTKFARIVNEIRSALSEFERTENEITDILVKYLYGIKKSANKTALWLCYGDIIYENLLSNNVKMETKEIQCIDCGKWFKVSIFDSATCRCEDCYKGHRRRNKTETMQTLRAKKDGCGQTL